MFCKCVRMFCKCVCAFSPRTGKMGVWIVTGALSSQSGLSGQAFHLKDWYKSCWPATSVSLPFRRHKEHMALEYLTTCRYWRGTSQACDNRGSAVHPFFAAVGESGLAGMVLCSPVSCCFLSPALLPSFSLQVACILLFLPSCRFC